MNQLHEHCQKLLEQGVGVIIGYAEAPTGRRKPYFVTAADHLDQLVFDEACRYNLAVYLTKKEVLSLGKPVLLATLPTLRSIIRLAVEHQVTDGSFSVLVDAGDGGYLVLDNLKAMEEHLSGRVQSYSPEDQELLTRLRGMSREERWAFWQETFQECIRCYACRQACPMCYCTTCAAASNQPQWIPVAPHPLGNAEWHLMRAMHLAGRCITCGQCGTVCPMGLPVHLLAYHLSDTIKEVYGTSAGTSLDETSTLSTFTPNDTENFIH